MKCGEAEAHPRCHAAACVPFPAWKQGSETSPVKKRSLARDLGIWDSSTYPCWYDRESRPLGQTVEDVRQEQHPVLATGKLALELRLPGDPRLEPRYKSNSLSQIRGQPLGAPSEPGLQGMNDLTGAGESGRDDVSHKRLLFPQAVSSSKGTHTLERELPQC